jgi:thioesterase domain-containing protein
MKNEKLERFLFEKIPLAKALAIRVVRVNGESAEISAPLAPNMNHMGTAFGGSLNAVLVLTCYSWLFNALEERGLAAHVVLKGNTIKYRCPVDNDFSAICSSPPKVEVERFFTTMKRKNRAQILLKAVVPWNGGIASEFDGVFVAVPD